MCPEPVRVECGEWSQEVNRGLIVKGFIGFHSERDGGCIHLLWLQSSKLPQT